MPINDTPNWLNENRKTAYILTNWTVLINRLKTRIPLSVILKNLDVSKSVFYKVIKNRPDLYAEYIQAKNLVKPKTKNRKALIKDIDFDYKIHSKFYTPS